MSCCNDTSPVDIDTYQGSIRVSVSAENEDDNETASNLIADIAEAIKNVISDYELDGIDIRISNTESQRYFSPHQFGLELEVAQDDQEDSNSLVEKDPRQMQFPFE